MRRLHAKWQYPFATDCPRGTSQSRVTFVTEPLLESMPARAPSDHAAPERSAIGGHESARGDGVQSRFLHRDVRRVQHAEVVDEIDGELPLHAFGEPFERAAQRLPCARHLAMLGLEAVAQLAHRIALGSGDGA